MDKKNALIGIILLMAGLGMLIWSSGQQQDTRREAAEQAARQAQEEGASEETAPSGEDAFGARPVTSRQDAFRPVSTPDSDDLLARPVDAASRAQEVVEEELIYLENAYMRAAFTHLGGTLKYVTLKNFEAERGSEERVVLHRYARVSPLSLARPVGSEFVPVSIPFEVLESSYSRLVFETELPGGVKVRRTFELDQGTEDGPLNYTIRHSLDFINPTDTAFSFDDIHINIGTAAPTDADPYGFDLNAGSRDNGKYRNISANRFKDGMFSRARPQVQREGLIEWGAVKNQFFTSILTPEIPARSIVALPVTLPGAMEGTRNPFAITAFLDFEVPILDGGQTITLEMDYYTGPKDFRRLSRMSLGQEDVMHLGWFLNLFIGLFAFFGKMLLSLLSMLYGWVGNWGWAIILMTVVVRLLLWPLTAKAARASKRMQELSKPMQEIKEKFKDNPQKQQQATIELFRKHKVNPLSGCWPVLLQFPIFIAMFNLLRNTADLRFAEWLWINDLSMPDRTIPLGTELPLIGAFINVLPFVWLASMYYQMKMMPQPSVDNAQVKIIKFMPFIFFPFTYFFSSGLVLYWTTTNCFSIFQAWMTKRTKDAEDIAIEQEIAESEKKKGPIQTKPIGKKKKKKDGPRRG